MSDYSNILTGLKIPSQIPLNFKEYFASEAVLKDLGISNNLAFTYYKGMTVYCALEGTRYEWKESLGSGGLLLADFVYPNAIVVNNIDYSNKSYNFYLSEISDTNNTYSVSNLGTGVSIYNNSTVVDENTQFNLRKLKSSNNSISLSENSNEIDIKFTLDTVPTDASTNPITSNAVFDATEELKKEYIVIPITGILENVSTGTSKAYFRVPFAGTLLSVKASLLIAQASGSLITVDINKSGTSILSTKLTIDNTEKTSLTAATPAVISDAVITDDVELTFDIDQIGTAGAKGLQITMVIKRA